MKLRKLTIIEKNDREGFVTAVNDFLYTHRVVEGKCQRNLYYAGIGSSAGHTPGSTQDLTKAVLDEKYMAFLFEGGRR